MHDGGGACGGLLFCHAHKGSTSDPIWNIRCGRDETAGAPRKEPTPKSNLKFSIFMGQTPASLEREVSGEAVGTWRHLLLRVSPYIHVAEANSNIGEPTRYKYILPQLSYYSSCTSAPASLGQEHLSAFESLPAHIGATPPTNQSDLALLHLILVSLIPAHIKDRERADQSTKSRQTLAS